MRPIKFRGKRTENGQWIYGSLIQKEGYAAIVQFHEPSLYNEYLELEVDPETVGQYTGRNDKSGIEIYEGDKYKSSYKVENKSAGRKDKYRIIGTVIFREPSFMVEGKGKYSFVIVPLITDGEVIGNIYDNPELLPENATLPTAKTPEA